MNLGKLLCRVIRYFRTFAKLAALCLFFIEPNLMMYIQPKTKLMNADVRDKKVEVLTIGVLAASIWKMVKTALE